MAIEQSKRREELLGIFAQEPIDSIEDGLTVSYFNALINGVRGRQVELLELAERVGLGEIFDLGSRS